MEVPGRKVTCTSRDISTDVSCDPCGYVGEKEEANCYCTVCNEYLCSDCARAHKRAGISRNHYLLEKDKMPEKKVCLKADVNCEKHEDKPLDYFCNTHDALCCSACVTLEHRDCTVKYIQDLVKEFELSGEYDAVQKKLKILNKFINETKSKVSKNVTIAKQVSDKFVDDVKRFTSEFKAKLESLEKTALEKAVKIRDKSIQTFSDLSSNLDTMKEEVDQTTEKIGMLSKLKQHRQLVIAAKFAQREIVAFEKKLGEFTKENTVREYYFCRDEDLCKILQSTKQLGFLEVVNGEENGEFEKYKTTNTKKQNHKGKETKTPCIVIQNKINTTILTVTHEKEINIKSKRDKKGGCDITGSTMIAKSRIAVADCHSSSVKLVDIDCSSILSTISLESPPRDVTCTQHSQLVVTVPLLKSLIYLNIGKQLTVNKKSQSWW